MSFNNAFWAETNKKIAFKENRSIYNFSAMCWLLICIKGLRKILEKRDQNIEVCSRLRRVTCKNVLTPILSEKNIWNKVKKSSKIEPN